MNNQTHEYEVLENGKIADLLVDININPTDYDIRLNGQRALQINESFSSNNIRTGDILLCNFLYNQLKHSVQKRNSTEAC